MNDPILEHFLAACGSNEPLKLGVGQKDELLSDVREFDRPFLVIGRSPDSDLVLDHWQVSRRHAYLQMIEGRWYCVDLGSRTGTHGGDPGQRLGQLEWGRAIQIGPFEIRPEAPPSPPKSSGFRSALTWELSGRTAGVNLWRMDRPLILIGRSAACKIRIVEPDVSKFHCSIVLTSEGAWVIDLFGKEGIFVNDQAVRCARIEDGDSLRIGRHSLRARYDSPPSPLPFSRTWTEPGQGLMTRGGPGYPVRFERPSDETSLPARLTPILGQDLATAAGAPGVAIDPSVNLMVHQFGLMQQQMMDQFHQTMLMMFEGFAAMHREQAGTLREEFDQVRKLSDEIELLRKETARLADEAAKSPTRTAVVPRLATNGHADRANQPPPGPSYPKAIMPEPQPGVDIHSQLLLRLTTIQNERQNRWQKILGMMSSKS